MNRGAAGVQHAPFLLFRCWFRVGVPNGYKGV